MRVKKLSIIESVINYELKKLLIGLDQTNFLLILENLNLSFFAPKQTKNKVKKNKLNFSPVQNVNYLGVALYDFLSMNAHVNNLCKKLAQTIDILSKLCAHNYVNMFQKRLLFQYICLCFGGHSKMTSPR